MTIGGWISMILSVGFVVSLFGWCLYRVFFCKTATDHLHGLDIESPDQKEPSGENP